MTDLPGGKGAVDRYTSTDPSTINHTRRNATATPLREPLSLMNLLK